MNAERFMTHSLTDTRLARVMSAAIEAVEPGKLVRQHLSEIKLPKYRRVFLLGIGKAAEPMTLAAAEILDDFAAALVITKRATSVLNGKITILEAGHPIPDERSLTAGTAALDFVSHLGEDDSLICLISGGGSALVTAPGEGITLEEIQIRTSGLLASGATIDEINNLRRKLDRMKGGGLARATNAHIVSLILSDVIGNSLETIASGLTVDPALGSRVQNIIIGDIRTAAQAAQKQAEAAGFSSEVIRLKL